MYSSNIRYIYSTLDDLFDEREIYERHLATRSIAYDDEIIITSSKAFPYEYHIHIKTMNDEGIE